MLHTFQHFIRVTENVSSSYVKSLHLYQKYQIVFHGKKCKTLHKKVPKLQLIVASTHNNFTFILWVVGNAWFELHISIPWQSLAKLHILQNKYPW